MVGSRRMFAFNRLKVVTSDAEPRIIGIVPPPAIFIETRTAAAEANACEKSHTLCQEYLFVHFLKGYQSIL